MNDQPASSDQPPPSTPDPGAAGAEQAAARSFGPVAEAYDGGRPGYPRAAAAWLAGEQACTVLEVGAGTGKLTQVLASLGHDVYATDVDEQMLQVLARRLPEVRVSRAAAEELPVPDRSVDVVVGAQCFHWFDLGEALPEVARVLKPGGRIAMAWNERDERIPWVRRLGRILDGGQERPARPGWDDVLAGSGLFGFVEQSRHPFWQTLDHQGLRDFVFSQSRVALLDEAAREQVLAEALALYDGFGRGFDGMQLPWSSHCWRATVTPRRTGAPAPGSVASGTDQASEPADVDPPTDDDTGTLLIDFR